MDRDQARQILGLPSHFTKQQLRAAYLERVRLHHPDLNSEASSTAMGQINEAKSILSKAPDPAYGIAGEELWSDLRDWRQIAQSTEVIPQAPPPASVGLLGRLTRRRRARSR
jgi:curved DNA-binding protein CbpA